MEGESLTEQATLLQAFLEAGAAGVTLVDLSADSLSRAVASLGGADIQARVHTYAGDVSVEGTAEAYVKETVERWGRVDVSVQCAGISLPSTDLVDLKVSDWDKTMGVNLRGGAFPKIHQACPHGAGEGETLTTSFFPSGPKPSLPRDAAESQGHARFSFTRSRLRHRPHVLTTRLGR